MAFSGNNMSAYKNNEELKMTDLENSNSKRKKSNRLKQTTQNTNSGVSLWMLMLFMSVRSLSNNLHTSGLPDNAAQCKGTFNS